MIASTTSGTVAPQGTAATSPSLSCPALTRQHFTMVLTPSDGTLSFGQTLMNGTSLPYSSPKILFERRHPSRVTLPFSSGTSSRKHVGRSAEIPDPLQGNMTVSVPASFEASTMSMHLSSAITGSSTYPDARADLTRYPSLDGRGGTVSTTLSLNGCRPLMKLTCENSPRTTTALPGNSACKRAIAGRLSTSMSGRSTNTVSSGSETIS